MKRKILFLIVIMIVVLMSVVYAASGTVSLKASSTTVEPGGTFTVTISANCNDGVNGIDTTLSYDTDKLELVSGALANNNFANLSSENQITVITNSKTPIKSADLYTLTFKVKDGVASGSTATIKTGKILLDSDASNQSSETIGEQTVTVTVKKGSKPENGQPENTQPGSESKENESTGSSEQNTKDLSAGKQIATKSSLPYAGVEGSIALAILILVVVAVVSYILYKKYRKV